MAAAQRGGSTVNSVHTFFTGTSRSRHAPWIAPSDPRLMHLPASGEGALARIHLIYVGPLDEQHRARELATAFLSARDHDPRLHLLVAGEGVERTWLERRLGHAATFLGALDPTRLGELNWQADLLICPRPAPTRHRRSPKPSAADWRCWRWTAERRRP